jgi:hypothetical protein
MVPDLSANGRESTTFRPMSTARSYVLKGLLACAAFIAGIAILFVAARTVGRPPLPIGVAILFLAALPSILIAVNVRRRQGSLYRWVNSPQVEIQADETGLRLRVDDHRRSIPWNDIAEMRTGPFPWYPTRILDASGRELAVVPVGLGDPLANDDNGRSTFARLLVANNPGQFVAVTGIGGGVRVRRASPNEAGAVEADLGAQSSSTAPALVIVIVVTAVAAAAALYLHW